ncbi:hypothetical protein PanWU01x14_164400, partial [Parasponia andersonii]
LFLFNYKFLLLKDILKEQLLEQMSFLYKKPKLIIVFVTIVWFVGNILAIFARCVCPRGEAPGTGEGAKSLRMTTPTPCTFSSPRLRPSRANS